MPWRKLPIPAAVGILAHAARWVVVSSLGLRSATGAFVACLIASASVTPIADRLRLPGSAESRSHSIPDIRLPDSLLDIAIHWARL